jgi:hypothetical protein
MSVPVSFSFHSFAPFWPAWMSDGCYSGAVATVDHFENASAYHTFGNEITVLYHAVDNG